MIYFIIIFFNYYKLHYKVYYKAQSKMNPNTDERKKVIFYIGNTLSDKTRLHQNHNYKTIIQPHDTEEAHTINVCSEANMAIHRHTNSVINYNAIIQLIFNILEQVF